LETFEARLEYLVKTFADGKHTVFAKKCGIAASTFQYYREGNIPKTQNLLRISETCNVSIDWLLKGRGEPFLDDSISEDPANENPGPPPISHIIGRFRQQDLLLRINWNLYQLEQANPETLHELNELLEFKLQKLAGKVEYDRRQRQRRIVKDKDRAPDEERRVAERRIASGE
jgi:transcriptional regulator with XRE-family HTH domain